MLREPHLSLLSLKTGLFQEVTEGPETHEIEHETPGAKRECAVPFCDEVATKN